MLSVGEKIKVRYSDGFLYTLDVEVTTIYSGDQFAARIERIFSDGGEITGGHILSLRGQEMTFKSEEIVR